MLLQIVVVLSILQVAFGGAATTKAVATKDSRPKTVSASLKEANVEGLDGLNLKVNLPFKVDEYTVGFRHTFGSSISRGPEAVYVKRSFDAGKEDTVDIEAEYEPANNLFSVAAKWVSDKLHLTVGVEGDTKDKVKSIEVSNSEDVKGSRVDTKLKYEIQSKKVSGECAAERDDTTLRVTYDTEDKDPVFELSQRVNDNNVFTPSISLRNGKMKYGYKRKWEGGSVEGTLLPGDKVSLEWADETNTGVWRTKADIPVDDVKGTRVSVTRDWKY